MSDVSLLGPGRLGGAIARRLLATGLDVTLWNRTPEKAAGLGAAGARVTRAPAEAFSSAPVALLVLADAAAIRDVLAAPGVAAALAGRTFVQMGTIAPDESRAFCREVEAAGGGYVEAPVLGSIPQAETGTLAVMVGGTAEQLAALRGILGRLSAEPLLVGPVGKAATLKLALNQLIGSLTCAFALSLGLVRREGIDVERFLSVLRPSALHAPTFDKKLQRMLDGDFASPTFPARHLLKDMALVARVAREAGLDARLPESVVGVLGRTLALGLADADYSALARAVEDPGAAG